MKGNIEVKDYFNKRREEKLLFLDTMRNIKDNSIINPLIEMLESEKETGIKEKILLILQNLIEKTDYKSLEKMFLSYDVFTRNAAVEMLMTSKSHLYNHLERLSKHKSKDIRKFAIDSLKEDSSKESLEIIGSRLQDNDINVQMTAVEYLGNLKAAGYAGAIENMLLNSDNLFFSCTALESLSKIRISKKKEMIIEKFKNNSDPVLLTSFIRYIGAVGEKDELEFLFELARNNKGIVKREFLDSVESIIDRINNKKLPYDIKNYLTSLVNTTTVESDKYEILQILSHADGNGEKVNLARKKLKSDSEIEVLSAIEIIGEIGNKGDIDTLDSLADSTNNDDILEAIGDAVEKLIKRDSE